MADEPKQTVSRCALAAAPVWEARSSQRWMDGLLPAYPSLWLPFFFSFSFFVASVKCKSSHLTPPQTVSHSLPSHLINHAIELNATQQKKKRHLAEGVTWFLPLLYPLRARLQLPGRFVCHGPRISPRPLFNRVHGGSFLYRRGPVCVPLGQALTVELDTHQWRSRLVNLRLLKGVSPPSRDEWTNGLSLRVSLSTLNHSRAHTIKM